MQRFQAIIKKAYVPLSSLAITHYLSINASLAEFLYIWSFTICQKKLEFLFVDLNGTARFTGKFPEKMEISSIPAEMTGNYFTIYRSHALSRPKHSLPTILVSMTTAKSFQNFDRFFWR